MNKKEKIINRLLEDKEFFKKMYYKHPVLKINYKDIEDFIQEGWVIALEVIEQNWQDIDINDADKLLYVSIYRKFLNKIDKLSRPTKKELKSEFNLDLLAIDSHEEQLIKKDRLNYVVKKLKKEEIDFINLLLNSGDLSSIKLKSKVKIKNKRKKNLKVGGLSYTYRKIIKKIDGIK